MHRHFLTDLTDGDAWFHNEQISTSPEPSLLDLAYKNRWKTLKIQTHCMVLDTITTVPSGLKLYLLLLYY
jgi:hypothetical protein